MIRAFLFLLASAVNGALSAWVFLDFVSRGSYLLGAVLAGLFGAFTLIWFDEGVLHLTGLKETQEAANE